MQKPRLNFWQIWNMSFGFLGIQFGWGLQMANMSAIYTYLGADADKLALLWLATPITGVIIQPLVGQTSDRCWTRLGRRRPFILGGALLASLALVLMPNVPTERLVVSGLYCYVRNPMYVGCMLALAGEIVLFHSPDLAVYAALAWLGVHGFVRLYEEPTLTHRYPLDYPLYRQNVPRWWPRFTPWNPGRAPHL